MRRVTTFTSYINADITFTFNVRGRMVDKFLPIILYLYFHMDIYKYIAMFKMVKKNT